MDDAVRKELFQAVMNGTAEEVAQLLQGEARHEVNAVDEPGFSPIHYASRRGEPEMVQALAARGADVCAHAQNQTSVTPVILAVQAKSVETVDLLLSLGADANDVNGEGLSPIHFVAVGGETLMAVFLCEQGADVNAMKYPEKLSPLHYAVNQGDSKMAQCLLHYGANRLLANAEGYIPLHLAAARGCGQSCTALVAEEAEEQASSQAMNGFRPVDFARKAGHDEVVALLENPTRYISKGPEATTTRKIVLYLFPTFFLPALWFLMTSCSWMVVIMAVLYLRELAGQLLPRGFFDSFQGPILSGTFMGFFLHCFLVWVFILDKLDWNEQQYFCYLSLVLIFLYVYLKWFSDPGFVEPSLVTYMKHRRERSRVEPRKSMREDYRFCRTCVGWRPIRSKHCDDCGKCVLRMDHHCYWLHRCVGEGNHQPFHIFHAIHLYLQYWYLSTIRRYLMDNYEGDVLTEESWFISILYNSAEDHKWAVGVASFHVLLIVFMGMLGIYSICNVSWNLTTNEHMKLKKYNFFNDVYGRYSNPFNRGILMNWFEFWFESSERKQKRWENAVERRLGEFRDFERRKEEEREEGKEEPPPVAAKGKKKEDDLLHELYGVDVRS
mmetsp:Transcript_3560/g.9692  ORF Transcript_3560/g.9692 Transcript_3560/m.9692 type:complete len:610 (+) Transcript_3560:84-1913(+)